MLRQLGIVSLLIVLLIACGGGSSESGVRVTKQELGAAWPFTVSEGRIECRGGSQVVFVANGKTYAVNGTAISQGTYANMRDIWAEDPAIPGLKISVDPIISRGLALCNK